MNSQQNDIFECVFDFFFFCLLWFLDFDYIIGCREWFLVHIIRNNTRNNERNPISNFSHAMAYGSWCATKYAKSKTTANIIRNMKIIFSHKLIPNFPNILYATIKMMRLSGHTGGSEARFKGCESVCSQRVGGGGCSLEKV